MIKNYTSKMCILLSEIRQAVKYKYHMISTLSRTWSITKHTSKQNITRDTEIKKKWTVTRGEMGEVVRGKGWRVFRNNYKGHMDKTKEGWNQGRRWGWLGWGAEERGKAENCTRTTTKIKKSVFILVDILHMKIA